MYKNAVPMHDNPHGSQDCQCQLFDVPDEPQAPGAQAVVLNALPGLNVQEQQAVAHQIERGLALYNRVAAGQEQFYRPSAGRSIGIADRMHEDGRAPLPEWLLDAWRGNECHYCERKFNSLRSLEQHQLTTFQHPVFACCGRTFKTQRDLIRHFDRKQCHMR